MKNIKTAWQLIGLALVFLGGFLIGRSTVQPVTETVVRERIDTLVVRDTVREEIPVPFNVYVVRIDTVAPDGTGTATVPVTRETYETDSYRAVVEGYRPRLIDLELYPQTVYITKERTVRVRRTWEPFASLSCSTLSGTVGMGGGTFYNSLGLSYEYQYSLRERLNGHRFVLLWKF